MDILQKKVNFMEIMRSAKPVISVFILWATVFMQSPESAEHLCGKTKTYADTWAPVADRLWQESQGRKAE